MAFTRLTGKSAYKRFPSAGTIAAGSSAQFDENGEEASTGAGGEVWKAGLDDLEGTEAEEEPKALAPGLVGDQGKGGEQQNPDHILPPDDRSQQQRHRNHATLQPD